MKKVSLFIIAIQLCSICFGQAKPSYTQYILNNYILNPALTGIENYTDIKLSHRNQWKGIRGAPVTNYLTIQGPIGKSDFNTSATSYQIPGENPRGKQYWQDYTAPEAHHGIGMAIVNDRTGYLNRWSIYGSYAYHKPLGVKTTLAGGFNAGISSVYLDRSQIEFASLNPNDPAIGTNINELRKIRPEIGAGLWLYSANYFAGISVQNIIPGKFKFVKDTRYGTYYTPNYFFTTGFRMLLNEDFNLIPSVMVQYWEPQLFGAHFNAKLQYQDKLWLGVSYRYSDLIAGYSAFAGLNVSNKFNVGYSYEISTTNRLRSYTGNTHEIIIGFLLGNDYGDTCPRQVW